MIMTQQRTVLFIDDSPEDRELYRRFLLQDGEHDYTILEAKLGQSGLEQWQSAQPDAVILDYRLPDLDGLEVLAAIQSQLHHSSLPVVMVTGQGDEAIAVQAMKAGAQDYLVKEQLSAVGFQTAVNTAIETVQLRTQLQQSQNRERLLSQIAQHIHRTLNLTEILQTTVTEVRQLLKTDRVLIFQLQSGGWGEVVVESVGDPWTALLSTTLHDPCLDESYLEPYRQGLVVTRSDIYDGTVDPCHMRLLEQFHVKAELVVPLCQSHRLWGMLIVHHCTAPRSWQPFEIELLKILATQAGIAIQQAELYEQAQRDLSDRKQAEDALRLAHDELELRVQARTWELEQANHQLQQEIRERKQKEAQIREQSALIDISPDAIFVLDLEGHILFWNRGAEQIYGWLAPEILGQDSYHLLVRPEHVSHLQTALKIVRKTGEWKGELHKITKSGEEVIVSSRWILMQDEAGRPKSMLAVDTNITEQKRLEAQFLQAQRLESLGTLASGIAHDMNNILTPILVSSQLLPHKLPNLDPKNQELLKVITDNSKRGAELVKQILAFGKGLEGQRNTIQVFHVIAEIERVIHHTFPKTIELLCDLLTQDLWKVSADTTQLHQVLMNLCVNARDAMPQGGILRITAQNIVVDGVFAEKHLDAQIGSYVVIEVSDTGIGIPPEVIPRMFEPFFTTKSMVQGTGLGLSTVIGIIKNHGGFIDVTSQVGKGSQFKIYLPAIAAGGAAINVIPR
jgi:two-component system, cell cycle sensor histidine kinase and response regulator CckA